MGISAAVNCSNKSNKAKNIVLYRLPKDKSIQKQWLFANLKRENIPTEVRVCSMHFEESCFKRDLEVIYFSILFKFSYFFFTYTQYCFKQ